MVLFSLVIVELIFIADYPSSVGDRSRAWRVYIWFFGDRSCSRNCGGHTVLLSGNKSPFFTILGRTIPQKPPYWKPCSRSWPMNLWGRFFKRSLFYTRSNMYSWVKQRLGRRVKPHVRKAKLNHVLKAIFIYRISSNKRPGRLFQIWVGRGRLFEGGRLIKNY